MTREATVLIVPGLRDHVPEHWQTLLASQLPRAQRRAEGLRQARLPDSRESD
jgi:predicted alpha/beta hydrolase family esterase